ncbi:hypothetical protein [Streptomyces sp. Ncost-T10-10d]|uniref:hypothetical protein n=1 Tax=Streptomyces sp. Ncost-T10-10d TaxID=1839774 RepID=UPI00081E511E|nr:hypothetical protein [Streptomyces sp. Ncost-T10-10d]SCF72408.1 hypothetical protein GA0115254_113118 [Streptomyces sp. Ncost-T10-10d]
MPAKSPAPTGSEDVRAQVHDLASLTPETRLRLAGLACARCGGTEALRPGGHTYTHGPDGGRLGWAVKVCAATAPSTCPRKGS